MEKPNPPPPDPRVETAKDEAAIRDVLAAYTLAYQRLDPAAVRRVWPSAPTTLELGNLRSYQVVLENLQITLRGDTATVTTVRRIRTVLLDGRAQERSVPTTFSLRRGPGSWFIERIQ